MTHEGLHRLQGVRLRSCVEPRCSVLMAAERSFGNSCAKRVANGYLIKCMHGVDIGSWRLKEEKRTIRGGDRNIWVVAKRVADFLVGVSVSTRRLRSRK